MRLIQPLLIVATLLLTGCAGKGSTADLSPTDVVPPTSETSAPPVEPNNTFVPKFHTHDYWAGRESIYLFNGNVQIGEDALGETTITSNGIIIGTTTFDTKRDGEHLDHFDATDVVYQGTERIDVTIKWSDTNAIPGINFYFKPANTPSFTLLGPLENGKIASIFLRQGMADMPHQTSLSRWKFKIEAFDPQTQALPMRAYRAMGSVAVEMKIFNGGDQFIDPPHPYFFTHGPSRFAGEMNQTFTNCLVVNNTRHSASQPRTPPIVYGCALDDYKAEPPHIVPWETTRVVVDLWYNFTAATSTVPHGIGLKFHASDSPEYRYPRPVESKPGYARYEISVTEPMTDSPYAQTSDWRFGVYPVLADQRDLGGDITGNLHILVTAMSDGAQGRGMGN
jgi:hypothetical protein